jgi:hypothetical protein
VTGRVRSPRRDYDGASFLEENAPFPVGIQLFKGGLTRGSLPSKVGGNFGVCSTGGHYTSLVEHRRTKIREECMTDEVPDEIAIDADTQEQASAAVRLFLKQRSVSLVGFRNSEPCEIGSATCIQIAGRNFLATAAHVILPYPDEQLLIVHQGVGPLPIMNRGTRGGSTNDTDDVAWLEVSADTAARIEKTFIPLSHLHISLTHDPELWTLMYGFPSKLIDKTKLAQQELGVTPLAYSTGTIAPENWPSDCDPSSDVVLNYPDKNNRLENGREYQLPDPHGMSGGGFWFVTPKTGSIWHPEAHLFGIDRAWWPHRRFARGTQVRRWLNVLGEDIPELATIINSHIQAQSSDVDQTSPD